MTEEQWYEYYKASEKKVAQLTKMFVIGSMSTLVIGMVAGYIMGYYQW